MKTKRKRAARPTSETLQSLKKGRANSGRYRRGSTTLTQEDLQTFLSVLMEGWSPTRAAEVIGKPRQTFYNLRNINEHFASAWEAAEGAGTDRLEDEARRRGLEGYEKPLSFKGQLTGDTVREYSDVLLMFMLNGRRPEKFRQNVKLDANVNVAASFRAGMQLATEGREKS